MFGGAGVAQQKSSHLERSHGAEECKNKTVQGNGRKERVKASRVLSGLVLIPTLPSKPSFLSQVTWTGLCPYAARLGFGVWMGQAADSCKAQFPPLLQCNSLL